MSRETVIVTGANSQLGVFLLPLLDAAGYAVRAVSRGAPREPLPVAGDVCWVQPGSSALLEPAECLVSCGPLDLAYRLMRRNPAIKKAVVFSTTSVHTKQGTVNAKERSIIAAIRKGERSLEGLCGERGVVLVLIRPTLIYGCGLDRNISLLLRLGERSGFIPLSSNAGGLRQPVHAEDLAELAVRALQKNVSEPVRGEACGGTTLQFRDMVERIAACGQRKIRLLGLPGPVLSLSVRIASLLGPWKGLNTEMVRRQALDMVFDDTVFRREFAFDPRPFNPTAADFRVPQHLQKYRLQNL